MDQINRIELKGNVGNVKFIDTTAGRMVRFSLATNYLYKTREGEAGIETTWHNVVAWEGRNIQNIDKVEKGASAHVFGRLRSSKFTGSDGIERTTYEVVANKLSVIDEDPEN